MKAVSVVPVLLACAAAPLVAQSDRPLDNEAVPMPKTSLLGTLVWPDAKKQQASEGGRLLQWVDPWNNPSNNELLKLLSQSPEEVEERWMVGMQLVPMADGGLEVTGVFNDSPAAAAGLRRGDVVTALNDLVLRDVEMVVDLVQIIQGQEISLSVKRGASEHKIQVTPIQAKPTKFTHLSAQLLPEDNLDPLEIAPSGGAPNVRAPAPHPKAPEERDAQPLLPNQRLIDQIRKDNEETQKLLRELIEEVKKIRGE